MRSVENVQALKIRKELYWPIANLLTSNPHRHSYFYIIIHYEATMLKEPINRVAVSVFKEILSGKSDSISLHMFEKPPLLTPTRKRDVAMTQQLLASEFAMQGGAIPYVRIYDATDVDAESVDVYL